MRARQRGRTQTPVLLTPQVLNSRKRRGLRPPCTLPEHVLAFEVAAARDLLKVFVLRHYNLSELCTG